MIGTIMLLSAVAILLFLKALMWLLERRHDNKMRSEANSRPIPKHVEPVEELEYSVRVSLRNGTVVEFSEEAPNPTVIAELVAEDGVFEQRSEHGCIYHPPSQIERIEVKRTHKEHAK